MQIKYYGRTKFGMVNNNRLRNNNYITADRCFNNSLWKGKRGIIFNSQNILYEILYINDIN